MEEKLKDIDERLDKMEETLDHIEKMVTSLGTVYIQYLDTKIKESQIRMDCTLNRQMNQCMNTPWGLPSL